MNNVKDTSRIDSYLDAIIYEPASLTSDNHLENIYMKLQLLLVVGAKTLFQKKIQLPSMNVIL